MRNVVIALLFFLVGLSLGWFSKEVHNRYKEVQYKMKLRRHLIVPPNSFDADFDSFLSQFATDTAFQRKHIKFPLVITETIAEKNEHAEYSVKDTLLTQVPESLEVAVHYTHDLNAYADARIIRHENNLYYFRFIDSAWYLVKTQKLLR